MNLNAPPVENSIMDESREGWDLSSIYMSIDSDELQNDIGTVEHLQSELMATVQNTPSAQKYLNSLQEFELLLSKSLKIYVYTHFSASSSHNDSIEIQLLAEKMLDALNWGMKAFGEWTRQTEFTEVLSEVEGSPDFQQYRHFLNRMADRKDFIASIDIEANPIATRGEIAIKHRELLNALDSFQGSTQVGVAYQTLADGNVDRDLREESLKALLNWASENGPQLKDILHDRTMYALSDVERTEAATAFSYVTFKGSEESRVAGSFAQTLLSDAKPYRVYRNTLSDKSQLGLIDFYERPSQHSEPLELAQVLAHLENAIEPLGKEPLQALRRLYKENRLETNCGSASLSTNQAHTVPEAGAYVRFSGTDNTWDASLLAHELGHAVHGELGGKNKFFNNAVSVYVSETVACFFQVLLAAELLKQTGSNDSHFAATVDPILYSLYSRSAHVSFEVALKEKVSRGEYTLDELDQAWEEAHKSLTEGLYSAGESFGRGWALSGWIMNRPLRQEDYVLGMVGALALYRQLVVDPDSFYTNFSTALSARGTESTEEFFKRFELSPWSNAMVERALEGYALLVN